MESLQPISKDEILNARQLLQSWISASPIVRLNLEPSHGEIYLKLENLHPTGSFKVHGAGYALLSTKREELENGVWTASAGNMALGLTWFARQLNVHCTVIVPEDTPQIKLSNLKELGAKIVKVPFEQYQLIQREHHFEGIAGKLIHPFADEKVMAGNATIGLEILEQVPDVDIIFTPYGGGGLSCGIASAMRAWKPDVQVFAGEVETGAPLAASLKEGKPTQVKFTPSFISGIGAPFVFPKMWGIASQLISASIVVSINQVKEAIRILANRHHIIAEGAGAVAVAAALHQTTPELKVVCVVSGGNIDVNLFAKIVQGGDHVLQ